MEQIILMSTSVPPSGNRGRRKIVAGNWKMNLSHVEAVVLAKAIGAGVGKNKCDVWLFPSFLYLGDVMKAVKGSSVCVGAQNCSAKENGALTGEVSAAQIMSMGAEHVLIGHSERRTFFEETNEMLRDKISMALKHELTPVFCCGEPLHIREEEKQEEYVLRQMEESLFSFSEKELANIVIAYEPVWAIGTGLNASAAQAQEMHEFIRSQIETRYSPALSSSLRILYGGSCNPANAKELFSCPDVDGGLIGGASLKANDFLSLIEIAG